MKLGYVVLYVNDLNACLEFWQGKIGMIEKNQVRVGDFTITKVGFEDQDFSVELVPLELMKENPDNLDLASPSIAFHVEDLNETHSKLISDGVQVSDIGDHGGTKSFGFCDNEGRWFAVLQG